MSTDTYKIDLCLNKCTERFSQFQNFFIPTKQIHHPLAIGYNTWYNYTIIYNMIWYNII